MVAIVLLRPQMGENIGAAARVMSNFGLTDLRIVAPRDGWPNDKATAMAAHGEHIIEQARVYETLPEALHGITFVYATTATRRDMNKPLIAPGEAFLSPPLAGGYGGESLPPQHSPLNPPASGGNIAVLFGPERAGLTNEDLVYANGIIEIPTSDENPSLNLAQAVCVIAYEYWVSQPSPHPSPLKGEENQLADTPTLQGYFDQLEQALDARGYFREPHKKPLMWQHLRNIFVKANLTEQEVRTLRGMVKAFER